MTDLNPYAPPRYDERPRDPVAAEAPPPKKRKKKKKTYWREGDRLAVIDGAKLPTEVCLATGNRSTGERSEQLLTWSNPLLALLVLVPPGHFLFWLLGYLAFRRRITLHYALSVEAHKRIRKGKLLRAGAAAVALFTMLVAAATGHEEFVPISLVLLIFSPFFGHRLRRPCRIENIDNDRALLEVPQKVLDALGLTSK